MTTVWFGGGEVKDHRMLLGSENVDCIGVNLSALLKQGPVREMEIDELDGFRLALYSSDRSLDEYTVDAFLDLNGHMFELIYDIPTERAPFVPVWRGGPITGFHRLANDYPLVGVSEEVAANKSIMPGVTSYARQRGARLMLNSSKAEAIAAADWEHVIVGSWISSQKQRELQVWDGRRVARYGRLRRLQAIEKHAGQIGRLGIDEDALRDGDVDANMRLAIRSWRLMQNHPPLAGASVVTMPTTVVLPSVVTPDGESVAIEVGVSRTPAVRARVPIPLIEIQQNTSDDGEPSGAPQKSLTGRNLMACDPCFLQAQCPGYQPHHECAYEFPVQVRTKDDLAAVMNTMLEMQTQRVLMGRFGEQVQSQGLSAEVSAEIERFMRMVESIAKMGQTQQTLTITATNRSEAGVLSRLFGEKVGEVNRRLDAPIDTKEIMTGIVDAEVVE